MFTSINEMKKKLNQINEENDKLDIDKKKKQKKNEEEE